MEQINQVHKSIQNAREHNTFIISNFNEQHLESIVPQLVSKVVEFDFSLNKKSDVFEPVVQFISKNSYQWRGLVLNLRYQKSLFPKKVFSNLAVAIERMEGVESLGLSFGGHFVSQYYAENRPNTNYEWDKSTNGQNLSLQDYTDLLEQFSRIISSSPNLKFFCLDFQGLTDDCINMVPQLTKINQSLDQCINLEEYILSLNHCNIYEDEKKALTEYLHSFSCLINMKYLKRFIMNISEWQLGYNNFVSLGKIISEYLTVNKEYLQEFQFDHSSQVQITQSNTPNFKNEMQIIQQSFAQFLQQNRQNLKIFYLSLVQYLCNDNEINTFMNIFDDISNCKSLEQLSIRIQNWRCSSVLTEEKFYKNLIKLNKLDQLKLLHISSFRSMLGRNSPFLGYAKAVVELLGKKYFVRKNQICQLKIVNQVIQPYYRNEIILHLQQLCSNTDYNNKNTLFSIFQ